MYLTPFYNVSIVNFEQVNEFKSPMSPTQALTKEVAGKRQRR